MEKKPIPFFKHLLVLSVFTLGACTASKLPSTGTLTATTSGGLPPGGSQPGGSPPPGAKDEVPSDAIKVELDPNELSKIDTYDNIPAWVTDIKQNMKDALGGQSKFDQLIIDYNSGVIKSTRIVAFFADGSLLFTLKISKLFTNGNFNNVLFSFFDGTVLNFFSNDFELGFQTIELSNRILFSVRDTVVNDSRNKKIIRFGTSALSFALAVSPKVNGFKLARVVSSQVNSWKGCSASIKIGDLLVTETNGTSLPERQFVVFQSGNVLTPVNVGAGCSAVGSNNNTPLPNKDLEATDQNTQPGPGKLTPNTPTSSTEGRVWLVTTYDTFNMDRIKRFIKPGNTNSAEGAMDSWCYVGAYSDPTCADRSTVASNFCRDNGFQEATSFKKKMMTKTYYYNDKYRARHHEVCDGKGQALCEGLTEIVCEKTESVTDDPGASTSTKSVQPGLQYVVTTEVITNSRLKPTRGGIDMAYSSKCKDDKCPKAVSALDYLCRDLNGDDRWYSDGAKTTKAAYGAYIGSTNEYCADQSGKSCEVLTELTCKKIVQYDANVFYMIHPDKYKDLKYTRSGGDYPIDAYLKTGVGNGTADATATIFCKNFGYDKAKSIETEKLNYTIFPFDRKENNGKGDVHYCGSIRGSALMCTGLKKITCVKESK